MTAPPGQLDPITPPPRPERRSHGRLVVRYLAALLFTVASAAVAIPDLVGLDFRGPFARAVAFRPWILVLGLVVLVVLLVIMGIRRRSRATLLPFAAGALAVLIAGAAVVLPRAVAEPRPTTGTPLTVLGFNALEGGADAGQLAQLIADQKPDLVSIPEAGDGFAAEIGPLVQPLGYRLVVSRPGAADVRSVIALVSDRLGDVSFRIGTETASYPYVEVTGGSLGALRFVAFHASAPTYFTFPKWRADMALLSQWCAGPTPAIVAGDFNATLDHSALRAGMAGCSDAADQRGEGLVPTWSPTRSTRLFGPQIDHVIMTGGIAAETFTVDDIARSDHRAVLSRLRVS